MGRKSKSKKEGKGDKKKNQKAENTPSPEPDVAQVNSPVLDAQNSDVTHDKVEENSTLEVTEVSPETADINLDQEGVKHQEQQEQQAIENWGMDDMHEPHDEDLEPTLIQDENTPSSTQDLNEESQKSLEESHVEETHGTSEETQTEPHTTEEAEAAEVSPSVDPHENIDEEQVPSTEAADTETEKAEQEPEIHDEPTTEDDNLKETEEEQELQDNNREEDIAKSVEEEPEAFDDTLDDSAVKTTEEEPEVLNGDAPENVVADQTKEEQEVLNEDTPENTVAEQTEEEPERLSEDAPENVVADQTKEEPEVLNEDTPDNTVANQVEEEPEVLNEDTPDNTVANQVEEEPEVLNEDTSEKAVANQTEEETEVLDVDNTEDNAANPTQDDPEEWYRDIQDSKESVEGNDTPTDDPNHDQKPEEDTGENKEPEEGPTEPEFGQVQDEVAQNLPDEAAKEPATDVHLNNGIPSAIAPAPLPSPVPSEPRSVHSVHSVHSPIPLPPDHPLSRHGSPLAYHASPSYRYASPQMQPQYSPYMIGMHSNTPPMPHPMSVAPSSASFATAYHSPHMEHTPMASPYMYTRRPSVYPNGNRDYYNGRMDRTLSGGSSHSQNNHRLERPNGHAEEEGHHDHHYLMGRIEKAMPDITRMLDSFKDTRNKLQAREAEARQLQAQHEQAIMHKDFYIEALQAQMKKAATETATEYGKLKDVISGLRVDLGHQQDKNKALEEFLETSRKNTEEVTQLKLELEGQVQTLQNKIEELERELERVVEEAKEHERAELAAQKEELTNLFEEIRAEDEVAANDRYNEREKELLDEQETMKSAWEEKQREMEEAHENLRTEHDTVLGEKHAELDQKMGELEAARSELETVREALANKSEDLEAKEKELDATNEELESKLLALQSKQEELEAAQTELQSTVDQLAAKKSELEDKHRELEDTHKQYTDDKDQLLESHATTLNGLHDAHSAELDALRDTHSTEVDKLRSAHGTITKEMEERLDQLLTESKLFSEKEKTWAAEKSTLQRHINEKLDELARVEREKDSLERDDVIREKHLQAAVDEMRRTIDNMENDREKLRKTLTSLGEATDLKTSKGDQFFVDSFNQLCRLIVELSKDHFSYLPIDPPKDILEKIPPGMPSFLDNTSASRELRSAYVQHVISKTLTYRIFQPFLFTLGRRYDKADTFFQVLSMDIRRKSVRREAFWRQQTLKAAYTTSDAKQSINVVAAVIVDEIVDHIKHFADPKQLDALLTGVRRIVKLAAETWRHARVERELVLATMPAPEADEDVNDGWEEYTCGRSSVENIAVNGDAKKPGRHVLLRVFPRIYREAAHEDFADDREKMNACVYFPGMILFSDSPSVLARRGEQSQKSGNASAGSSGENIRSA